MIGRAGPHGAGSIEQPNLLAGRHGPRFRWTGYRQHVDLLSRRAQQFGDLAVGRGADKPAIVTAGNEALPVNVKRQAQSGSIVDLHGSNVVIRGNEPHGAIAERRCQDTGVRENGACNPGIELGLEVA
jgi:hypothetical protein